MISVRGSRAFTGDAPISLVGLAKLERRTFPVSVREMATVESREFDGSISAGDVDCTYQVTLYNSGRWFITADFRDNGDLVGDFFVLDFPIDGQGRGLRLDHGDSALGHGQTDRMSANGLDEFIRNDWPRIRGAPLTAKLSASPDIGSIITVIATIAFGIGVIAFVFGPGKVTAGPCDG